MSESIDWARTLLALSIEHIDEQVVGETLHVLLEVPNRHRQGRQGAWAERQCRQLTMITLLTDFIGELRAAGIPVSMVEAIDAMEAVKLVDIGDRSALKGGPGRHPGQERPALPGLRRRLRGLLRPSPNLVGVDRGCAPDRSASEGGQSDGNRFAVGHRRSGRCAVPGDHGRRRRCPRGGCSPGGRGIGGHRTGTSGRWHLLPLPDTAPARSRRPPGEVARGGAGRARRGRRPRHATGTRRGRTLRSPGCARRSRTRFDAVWSPTAAGSRWPEPYASRWSRTSISCTRLAPTSTDIEDVIEPLDSQARRSAGPAT